MDASSQKIDIAGLAAIAVIVGGFVVTVLGLAVLTSVVWP